MIRIVTLFIIITGQSFLINAQYLDHKLEISMTGTYEVPIGPSQIKGTPTLFSNYELGYGYTGEAIYIVGRLKPGLVYSFSQYVSFDNNSTGFLQEPKSTVVAFGPKLSTELIQFGLFKIDFFLGIMGISHIIQFDEVSMTSEVPFDIQESYTNNGIAFLGGMCVNYDFSNKLQMGIDLSYKQIRSKSPLYIENTFHVLSLGFGLKWKFLRNKYYLYE